MDNIGDRDFILGIQTEFQRDMLPLFGSSSICVYHQWYEYVQFHFVDDHYTRRIWRRNTCMDDIKQRTRRVFQSFKN